MGKPSPNTELCGRIPIEFLHPGYPDPNILFPLPRVDSQDGTNGTTIFGIFHHTALLACQIVAGNAFDGYLTLDQEGQQCRISNITGEGLVNESIPNTRSLGGWVRFLSDRTSTRKICSDLLEGMLARVSN